MISTYLSFSICEVMLMQDPGLYPRLALLYVLCVTLCYSVLLCVTL